MSARRNPKTNSARAYYRLAAKFARAGNRQQAEHYRKVADRLTDEVRRDREHRAERAAAEAAWRAKRAAAQESSPSVSESHNDGVA